MPMPPIASIHDPLRRNDCGNWEPRPNYHNGEQFCANCSGWRRYHQPFFAEEQAKVVASMTSIVRNFRSEAINGPDGRSRLIQRIRETAQQSQWTVHEHGSHETNDRAYRPNSYVPPCSFPELLLFGADRLEPAVIEPYGDFWGGARPGGIIGVFIRVPPFQQLNTHAEHWADRLGAAGAETLLVTPETLPAAILRITGRTVNV